MSVTKGSFFETEELRKAREDYKGILSRRQSIERELAELRYMGDTVQNMERRNELLTKYEVVKVTQEEMRETIRFESDRAFADKVRTSETRLEALECLYRVVTRYLCYKGGTNGPVDQRKLDQYWAAVIFTAQEVSRFNKMGDEKP